MKHSIPLGESLQQQLVSMVPGELSMRVPVANHAVQVGLLPEDIHPDMLQPLHVNIAESTVHIAPESRQPLSVDDITNYDPRTRTPVFAVPLPGLLLEKNSSDVWHAQVPEILVVDGLGLHRFLARVGMGILKKQGKSHS